MGGQKKELWQNIWFVYIDAVMLLGGGSRGCRDSTRKEVIDVNLEAATDHRTRDYPKIFLRNLKKKLQTTRYHISRERERENFAMNLNEIN